jgi:hypothetical protein
MGKTYKKYHRGYYRHPRGYKQAIINNVRYGARPPHAWDDTPVCDLVHLPYTVARKLEEKGLDRETATKKLVAKFKLSYAQASEIVSVVYPNGPIFDWAFV